jgi:hypothetical protein
LKHKSCVAAKPRVCSIAAEPRFLNNYRGRAASLTVAAKPRVLAVAAKPRFTSTVMSQQCIPRFLNKYRASLTVAAKPRVYRACGRGVQSKPRFLNNYRGRAASLMVAAKPRLY